jgi:hypothetical protein
MVGDDLWWTGEFALFSVEEERSVRNSGNP